MSGRGKGGAFGGAGKARTSFGGKGTAVPNSSGTRGVGARRHRYVGIEMTGAIWAAMQVAGMSWG